MGTGGKKMAVFAGCNYAGTEAELHGTINDVTRMRDLLVDRFEFEPWNIEFMTDDPDSLVQPTGANIKAALYRMFQRAEPGDVLFFHFSGHGTQIPKEDGGLDEAIVACDLNPVIDDCFRELVNGLPRETSFTFISDSCHSGGLIDKEKEQIGPYTTPNYETEEADEDDEADEAYEDDEADEADEADDGPLEEDYAPASKSLLFKPKVLAQDVFLRLLRSVRDKHEDSSEEVGDHVAAHFGEDASSKFRPMSDAQREIYERMHPDMGILLSGCQSDECSMDVREEGVAYGALSNAIQLVLEENQQSISNQQLGSLVRSKLEEKGYPQHACLYCSDDNAAAAFLGSI